MGDFIMSSRTGDPQRTCHQIPTISGYAQRSRSELSSQSKADTRVRKTESRNQHQFIFSPSRQRESFQRRIRFSPFTSSPSRESCTRRRHDKTLRMDTRHVPLVSHRSKHKKCHVCNKCLQPFSTKEAYDNHLPCCLSHPVQQVI